METTTIATAKYFDGKLELQQPLPYNDGMIVQVTVVPVMHKRLTFPTRKGHLLSSVHRRDIYDDVK